MNNNSYATALKKVKGLGTAKSGTYEWWILRKTSIILIPLTLWFIWVINSFLFDPELVINALLYSPFRFLCFLILLNLSIFHGMLGMKEICEDYIHKESYKFATIFLIQCLSWFTMIALSLTLVLNFFVNI
jgi:succinate dehydrogenase / fumarate reductase membrane anchor subunit